MKVFWKVVVFSEMEVVFFLSRQNRDTQYCGLKPLHGTSRFMGADASVREPNEGRKTRGFLWGEWAGWGWRSRGNRDTHWEGDGAKAPYT